MKVIFAGMLRLHAVHDVGVVIRHIVRCVYIGRASSCALSRMMYEVDCVLQADCKILVLVLVVLNALTIVLMAFAFK